MTITCQPSVPHKHPAGFKCNGLNKKKTELTFSVFSRPILQAVAFGHVLPGHVKIADLIGRDLRVVFNNFPSVDCKFRVMLATNRDEPHEEFQWNAYKHLRAC